jgi:hypothetical protein
MVMFQSFFRAVFATSCRAPQVGFSQAQSGLHTKGSPARCVAHTLVYLFSTQMSTAAEGVDVIFLMDGAWMGYSTESNRARHVTAPARPKVGTARAGDKLPLDTIDKIYASVSSLFGVQAH